MPPSSSPAWREQEGTHWRAQRNNGEVRELAATTLTYPISLTSKGPFPLPLTRREDDDAPLPDPSFQKGAYFAKQNVSPLSGILCVETMLCLWRAVFRWNPDLERSKAGSEPARTKTPEPEQLIEAAQTDLVAQEEAS